MARHLQTFCTAFYLCAILVGCTGLEEESGSLVLVITPKDVVRDIRIGLTEFDSGGTGDFSITLPAGRHTIWVDPEPWNFGSVSETVEVGPGKTTLRITLEEKPSGRMVIDVEPDDLRRRVSVRQDGSGTWNYLEESGVGDVNILTPTGYFWVMVFPEDRDDFDSFVDLGIHVGQDQTTLVHALLLSRLKAFFDSFSVNTYDAAIVWLNGISANEDHGDVAITGSCHNETTPLVKTVVRGVARLDEISRNVVLHWYRDWTYFVEGRVFCSFFGERLSDSREIEIFRR